MGELVVLILILVILWPILKFAFKLTFGVIFLILAGFALLWVLIVMGGCAVLLA